MGFGVYVALYVAFFGPFLLSTSKRFKDWFNKLVFEQDVYGFTMILPASEKINIALNNFTQNKPIGVQDCCRALRKLKALMKDRSQR